MSTVKQKIMEVLMSADNGLSASEINWAIKNIPNETINGEITSDLPYEHEKKDMFEACGITGGNKPLSKEYTKLRETCPSDRKSALVEHVEKNASPALLRSFLIRGIFSVEKGKEEDVDDIIPSGSSAKITTIKLSSSDSEETQEEAIRKLKEFLKKLKGGEEE
jgi:hypothetical protein